MSVGTARPRRRAMEAAQARADGEDDDDDEEEYTTAGTEGFESLAKKVNLVWAAILLMENYRYPPSALAGEHPSNWELVGEDVLDEKGQIRERLEFHEVLPGEAPGACLAGRALLLINRSSRKKFSMDMRKELLQEAEAYSLTMVLHLAGSVAGQVTNLNVARSEPRIEVHSGRAFYPQFGPLAYFTDFRLIPTGPRCAQDAAAGRCELQRVTQDISSILQQQGEHVLKCVAESGTREHSLISPGGVCEARFQDDGRALARQVASALGVLPARVRCIKDDDDDEECVYVVVQGEPLEDIGQLRVARPISAEVMYTGALEGDVVETVRAGRLSFFVVAPDASLEPRRRRILESLRKPSEMHALQTSVFLDVQAATERRYRELLREEEEAMRPLSTVDSTARQAPRRALNRIHAVVGSADFREARGDLTLSQAQVAALGQADACLGRTLEQLTSTKPPVIWKEDVVLDAVAQAVWHVRWCAALARSIHGLPPALEDIDEDSDNEMLASQDGSVTEGEHSTPPASDDPASESNAEEEALESTAAADDVLAPCAQADDTLAEVAAPANELPEEHSAFLRGLASAMESRSVHLRAADVSWMRHAPRRAQWLRLAEAVDEAAANRSDGLTRKARLAFWKACASNEMLDDVARACQSVGADPRVTLEQQLDLLDLWVAGNTAAE